MDLFRFQISWNNIHEINRTLNFTLANFKAGEKKLLESNRYTPLLPSVQLLSGIQIDCAT